MIDFVYFNGDDENTQTGISMTIRKRRKTVCSA